jgi:hypothetical protein
MKLGRIIPLMLMTLSAQGLHATNALGSGTITSIGSSFSNPSLVYFGISPTPQAKAGCSTHSTYQFEFDSTVPEGKILYAAILAAKVSGSTILVYGSGTCLPGQQMEGIGYWIIDP